MSFEQELAKFSIVETYQKNISKGSDSIERNNLSYARIKANEFYKECKMLKQPRNCDSANS